MKYPLPTPEVDIEALNPTWPVRYAAPHVRPTAPQPPSDPEELLRIEEEKKER